MQGRYAFIIPCTRLPEQQLFQKHHRIREDLVILASEPQWTCLGLNQSAFPWRKVERYWLLGTVFERRNPSPPLNPLNGATSDAADLFASFWGSFVAVRSTNCGSTTLLRDPSGHLPCYFTKGTSEWIVASDVALLQELSGKAKGVNWKELGDCLAFPGHFGPQTCVSDVRELLAGEALILNGETSRTEQVWCPHDFLPHSKHPSLDESELRLSEALDEVHQQLATANPASLITLSGGLDSSIVATTFSRYSRDASFLNLFTDDAEGDERKYARMVANICKRDLAEYRYEAPALRDYFDAKPHLPRPSAQTIGTSVNRTLIDQALLRSHSAILTGFGGDNVFCSSPSSAPWVDCILATRSIRSTQKVLEDLVAITGASVRQLIWHGIRQAYARRAPDRQGAWRMDPKFLHPDLTRQGRPSNPHPWLTSTRKVAPGKARHIAAITRAHIHLERFPRTEPITYLAPLLFAPVVEAALAIPSWLWCAGGIDRSVARRNHGLPGSISRRRSKSTPITMHTRFFETNRTCLRDFLLNGKMVHQGLLDQSAIAQYMARPLPATDLDYLRLLELVDAEIWCSAWSG